MPRKMNSNTYSETSFCVSSFDFPFICVCLVVDILNNVVTYLFIKLKVY